jgi:hypothetical protein
VTVNHVPSTEVTSSVRSPDPCESLHLRSEDARLSFVLLARRDGLYVARTRRVSSRGSLVQSSLFSDSESFARWCDADATRFADPLLWHRVKKRGIAAFDATLPSAGGAGA